MIDTDGLDDRGLISGFCESGEMRYLDALIRRHIGRVRSMVYPMVLNDADADDVTQEVFVKVSRNIGRFQGRAKFSSWLHRITMNTTMDFLRARSRRPAEARHVFPKLPDPKPGPGRLVASRELGDQIADALDALSPRLRAAITTTAMQGLSTRDAAKACCCLPATLSWRVHQARKMLRENLNQQGAI